MTNGNQTSEGTAEVQPSPPKSKGRFWAFVPFIIIGLAMIPNAIMIATARIRAPASVEDRPYEASALIDDEKLAIKRFQDLGFDLDASVPESGTLELALQGPSGLTGVEVLMQRHDTAALDKTIAWDVVGEPLAVAVPRLGRWTITLTGTTADGEVVRTRTWEMVR